MEKVQIKRIAVLSCGFLILPVLGWLDYITGYDLNFFVFYFIPISIIAWHTGRPYAIGVSLLAALVWLYVDKFSGHPYTQPEFVYWNAFVRCSSFIILALAIAQIRSMLEKEKQLKDDLGRALEKIKEMAAIARKVAEGDLASGPMPALRSGGDNLEDTFDFMVKKLAEQKSLEKRLHLLERQAIMAETASFLAHEIRNPLNLIMLTAHHLGNQFSPHEGAQKEKFDELILSLKSEVEQLDKVVTDFMAIGKSTGIAKTRFRLADLIDQVVTLIKQQLVAKKISFKLSGDLDSDLFADQEKIRLVLLNILVNAIAVVPENGNIWIEARKTGSPESLRLVITDSGPGIEPDEMQKIFEPYFTRRPGGTGLGLSLAKRIIEDHNGAIVAGNCPNAGARFTITLPMEAK
jgi:signal transduction histidine kinase